MPAKTRKVEDLIGVEREKFEEKLSEFQQYLQDNSIISKISGEGEIDLITERQELLHKEILVQIKMQDAILNWLPLLKSLKETDAKKLETRGDVPVNRMFENRKGNNAQQ